MILIYVAGPYTGDSYSEIHDNIVKAEYAAMRLWKNGYAAITPHLNTAHFEKYEDDNLNYNVWIEGDMEILSRCDVIFMLKDWTKSKGAVREHEWAIKNDLSVYYEEEGYPKC